MQRKNNILKSSRSGVALIMAIAAIVVISTIMALALALTSQTTKKTTNLYLHEQSLLLAKSATEYALLRAAQDNNSTNPCNFTGKTFTQDNIYVISISAKYIYTSFPASCNAAQRYATVTTAEQNGSILLDISVSVTDTTITPEPIRYFKRTIQKL